MSRDLNDIIEVTPTITAGAYTAGWQVGGVKQLVNVMSKGLPWAEVISLTVIDKADQKAALEVYLFDELPTLASADAQAFSISDAEAADKCLGRIDVAASDYKSGAQNAIATVRNIWQVIRAASSITPAIYMVARTSGTPTYASTTDLVFKFGVKKY